jgi:hypothetical protein
MANKSDRVNPMFKSVDRSTSAEKRDLMVHQGVAKERADTDAKTVRLKALRLEKEEADKAAAALKPAKPAKAAKKIKNPV